MQNKFNAAINIHGEMKNLKGEDSHSEFLTEEIGYMGVYDGCGHLDDQHYERAYGLSGAYLSSRVAALQIYRWFSQCVPEPKRIWNTGVADYVQGLLVNSLIGVHEMLSEGEEAASLEGIKMPLSANMWFYNCMEEATRYKFLWAGDARGYILNSAGLAKITVEDDADNQVNASKPFVMHQKSFMLKKPCIVLSATKGAYGFAKTPIDFEHLILDALSKAVSFDDWEAKLDESIRSQASEDFTLSAAVFGYDSFEQFKNSFNKRLQKLRFDFINPMEEKIKEDEACDLSEFIASYNTQYERFLK